MKQKNVFGEELLVCGCDPMTGFYRNGSCDTEQRDVGSHTICAVMSDEFLNYSKSKGNDLITAIPEFDFPGLLEGDRWCVCAQRWLEAYEDNVAPKIIIAATNEKVLEIVSIDILKKFAVDLA